MTVLHLPPRTNRTRPAAGTIVRRARRRGVLTLELVILLPFLLVVLLAVVQSSTYLLATQAVQAATLVGARQATLPSANEEKVTQAVRRALGSWRFRSDAVVSIRPDHWQNLPSGRCVAVTVKVDAARAAFNGLGMVPGLDLKGKQIRAQYVMRKE